MHVWGLAAGNLRLLLWQRPMHRVSAPSISRPRPVQEAGLNHFPDRQCHPSFGHLWYPVGNCSHARRTPRCFPCHAKLLTLHCGRILLATGLLQGGRTQVWRSHPRSGRFLTSAMGSVRCAVLILCWTDAELCISKGGAGVYLAAGRAGEGKRSKAVPPPPLAYLTLKGLSFVLPV